MQMWWLNLFLSIIDKTNNEAKDKTEEAENEEQTEDKKEEMCINSSDESDYKSDTITDSNYNDWKHFYSKKLFWN